MTKHINKISLELVLTEVVQQNDDWQLPQTDNLDLLSGMFSKFQEQTKFMKSCCFFYFKKLVKAKQLLVCHMFDIEDG